MKYSMQTFSPGKFIRQLGISHVELMIAIALVSVVSVTALPGVGRMMERSKVMDTRQQLLTDLNYARNTAVNNYRRIVVCPSNNQQTCNGAANWRKGWIIFQDFDANDQRSRGEPVLRVSQLADGISLTSGQRDHFRFYPDGTAPESSGNLLICITDKPHLGHRLVISKTGRMRTEDYHCR